MEVLKQCFYPYDAAVKLADWGVKEVLLTLGDKGSLIYVDERFYEIPAYPDGNVSPVPARNYRTAPPCQAPPHPYRIMPQIVSLYP